MNNGPYTTELRCLDNIGSDKRYRNIDHIKIKLYSSTHKEGASEKLTKFSAPYGKVECWYAETDNCYQQNWKHGLVLDSGYCLSVPQNALQNESLLMPNV